MFLVHTYLSYGKAVLGTAFTTHIFAFHPYTFSYYLFSHTKTLLPFDKLSNLSTISTLLVTLVPQSRGPETGFMLVCFLFPDGASRRYQTRCKRVHKTSAAIAQPKSFGIPENLYLLDQLYQI